MKTIVFSKSKMKIKDVTKNVLRSYDDVNCSENTPFSTLKNEGFDFKVFLTTELNSAEGKWPSKKAPK